MKFYNLLNFSLLAISITYSQGAPLDPRVNFPFFVLNSTPKISLSCSAAQIAYIKTAVAKAADIASSAANVYSTARMSQNPIVQSFIGQISEAEFQAEVNKRFRSVAQHLEQTLTEASADDEEKLQEDDALSFFCKNSKTLLAVTSNKLDNPPASENSITLGKLFFQTESAEALFNKDKAIFEATGGDLTKWDKALDNPAHTLVHEAQHSLILLSSTNAADSLEDLTNSPGKNNRPNACIALSDADKKKNAENWALLAFVAAVDPDGVRGCTPGTPSRRAVVKAKGTKGTKLSCPFVPKGKTAATTGQTTTPATSKKTTKATPGTKKTTTGTPKKTTGTTKKATGTPKKTTKSTGTKSVPKKTTTTKKVTPVKNTSKKVGTTKTKTTTAKKNTAAKSKTTAPKKTTKKVTPVKKTTPVKKVTPVKKTPQRVAVKKTTKRV